MKILTFLSSSLLLLVTTVAWAEGADFTEKEEVKISMTAGQHVITAVIANNSETSKEFLATLPRTISMTQWGGREFYGHLGEISRHGEALDDFHNGDVTYYPPSGSLALFYDKEESSNQGNLIRMGRITSSLDTFKVLDDSVDMRIEVVP